VTSHGCFAAMWISMPPDASSFILACLFSQAGSDNCAPSINSYLTSAISPGRQLLSNHGSNGP
jgi:hypothetical protein